MIKRVVLDKADRLYHFPFDLEDFFPKRAIKSSEKRIPTIDLGRFRWPIKESEFPAEYDDCRKATDEELFSLKETISKWLMKEYKVKADPQKEIYLGQGIRRIIFDFCLAYVEYGDIILCPEPGMPFYRRYVISVGGVPVTYTISGRTSYKPSFARLPANLGKSAKVLFLNSPNNPFGTALDDTELAHLVRMASRQNIFIINDAAYCSLADEKHVPIRSVPGGGKVGLEIFSVPFTFGLPYIPLGFAVGPPEVISGLETIGKTVGIVIPGNWVEPTLKAIDNYPPRPLVNAGKSLEQSRLKAEQFVERMGWNSVGGKSCPFVWVEIPERKQAAPYAAMLLRRRRILTLPGTAFGETGEGHLRLSLTAPPEDYSEAINRLSRRMVFRSKTEE